ncbi:hypothetical protein [Caulobacter hibisci]|uniref:DUF1513 domain-containing protein n=1 Tax=Caulobacter hibisci TaxID=2035993 RepID=A0ABS0T2Z8_9CAUL|nr:hypothetical protein [Caulobacter hibisci]MBI1686260.1 hypothetical protein [Caulobacter hibisci]
MVSGPARKQGRGGWRGVLRCARAIAVGASGALLAACATTTGDWADQLDGRARIANLGEYVDCVIVAHSATLEKVLFTCTPGVVVIVSTDTGARTVLKLSMMPEQPFVHRDGKDELLYFPGGGDAPAIREIDLGAGTVFDRPMIVPQGFHLMSVYLNPRDRCLVASLVAQGPWPQSGVLRAYDYDPRGRTPVRLDAPGVIEVSQGKNPRNTGAPNIGGLICVRDKAERMTLLLTQFEQDDRPGAIGTRITRVTATEQRVIHRASELLQFFQPKLAPYVYARNGIFPGMLKIDVDTGAVTTIGDKVDGAWEDFDPQTGLGMVSSKADKGHYRICLADLNGCRRSVWANTQLFTGSVSNGWLGDGFIAMSSNAIYLEPFPAQGPPGRRVWHYWFETPDADSPPQP